MRLKILGRRDSFSHSFIRQALKGSGHLPLPDPWLCSWGSVTPPRCPLDPRLPKPCQPWCENIKWKVPAINNFKSCAILRSTMNSPDAPPAGTQTSLCPASPRHVPSPLVTWQPPSWLSEGPRFWSAHPSPSPRDTGNVPTRKPGDACRSDMRRGAAEVFLSEEPQLLDSRRVVTSQRQHRK